MRLSLRFIVPLLVVLAAVAYAILPLVDRLTVRWFVRDLDIRANLIATTIQEPLPEMLQAGNRTRIAQFFAKITEDERLYLREPCVRVVYPAAQGELVLQQQLIDSRVVFQLVPPRGFPADSLARLRSKVKE